MKVLVTGHCGYIGSVTTSVLQHGRFEVAGLDCDLYEGCDFGRVRERIPSLHMDLRDVESSDLRGFDAVVHLAALTDDASGAYDSDLIEAINCGATLRLAECCKKAGVRRFLFASSCSVYGRGGTRLLDERCRPQPLTAYARSKLFCERELMELSDAAFTPVILRLATVYGVSPRLRMDTVVNEFVGSVVTQGQVVMKTAGCAWRPLVHVEDLGRTFAALLVAPDLKVGNEVFNVLPCGENHRVIDIADAITELLPDCRRVTRPDHFDAQSYRVDGSKLARTLPLLQLHWRLPAGILQLHAALTAARFTPSDWRLDRYRRAERIKALREQGAVNASLRKAALSVA